MKKGRERKKGNKSLIKSEEQAKNKKYDKLKLSNVFRLFDYYPIRMAVKKNLFCFFFIFLLVHTR